jgi:hypothetical protein
MLTYFNGRSVSIKFRPITAFWAHDLRDFAQGPRKIGGSRMKSIRS